MKFVRFGESGAERPGVLLDDDTIGDLSSIVGDLGPTTLHDLPGIVEKAQLSSSMKGTPILLRDEELTLILQTSLGPPGGETARHP